MNWRVGVALTVASFSVLLLGCGQPESTDAAGPASSALASTTTTGAVSSTAGQVGDPGGATSTSPVCSLLEGMTVAPDSEKTSLLREIASEPDAAAFAELMTMYADLRDSTRGVPVSRDPDGLTLDDPRTEEQMNSFRSYATDECGIAEDLLD